MLKLKAPASQNLPHFWEVCDAQDDIDVLVQSCLRTKKSIDGPTAVEPHLDPSTLE